MARLGICFVSSVDVEKVGGQYGPNRSACISISLRRRRCDTISQISFVLYVRFVQFIVFAHWPLPLSFLYVSLILPKSLYLLRVKFPGSSLLSLQLLIAGFAFWGCLLLFCP